jgi:hypothetical protein
MFHMILSMDSDSFHFTISHFVVLMETECASCEVKKYLIEISVLKC